MARRPVSSSQVTGDFVGWDVDLRDSLLVIGAPSDDTVGFIAGAAYVFHADAGGQWLEEAKLLPGHGRSSFGSAVAVEDGTVFASTYANQEISVYRHDGSAWDRVQIFGPGNPGDAMNWGFDLEVDDGVLAVSAWSDSTVDYRNGSVYLYEDDGTGWLERWILRAGDPGRNEWFGQHLSMHAGVLAVSAPLDSYGRLDHAGSASVFRRVGDAWVEETKLIPTDVAADQGCYGVATDGRTVFTSTFASPSQDPAGFVYRFEPRELMLVAEPTTVSGGDTLSLQSFPGEPGRLGLMAVVAIDDGPLFFRLDLGPFDGECRRQRSGTVPPGLAGLVVDFAAVGWVKSGRLVLSEPARVEFR